MLRTILIATCMSMAFAFGAAAQDDTRAAAERYVKLPSVQKSVRDMVSVIEPMLNAMGGANLPADKKEQLIAIIQEEMGALLPAIEAAMIDAAAKTFSLQELETMIAFYSTPEGEAILLKTQAFTQAYLATVTPELQAAQQRIVKRVQSEIQQ
ncbi:MAG: DUF2059 domain-containing protein [Rhizobiaceae bacterium]